MPQTRLHFIAQRPQSAKWFEMLEFALEDEGYPLAIAELDETGGRDEISVYVEGDPGQVERKIRAVLGAQAESLAIEAEILPDIDWVSKTLEGLRPVRAGRFIVHGAHDRHERRPGDLAIEIEAGQAFGTGHHGTTAGCLEMLEQVALGEHPHNALDLGTGSAVLAIALAKLARIPVLATDIDPVAVRVAAANVQLNEVGDLVQARQADGFHDPIFARAGPFDLIVANILARPLMDMAPAMAGHISAGGSLILSGILDHQSDAVVAAYMRQGFRHIRTSNMEGWATSHLKR